MGTDTSEKPLPKRGKIEQYVEENLFGDTIDTLKIHVKRKSAVADSLRYSILYLLYRHDTLPRKKLAIAAGRESNGLQHHLRDLLNSNLIAEVPTPEGEDGRTSYYRITKLGIQEIEADVRNITGNFLTLRTQGGPRTEELSGDDTSGSESERINLGEGPMVVGQMATSSG